MKKKLLNISICISYGRVQRANKACDEYLYAFHIYVQRQGPIPSTCKKQCTMNNFKNKSNAKKENKFLI